MHDTALNRLKCARQGEERCESKGEDEDAEWMVPFRCSGGVAMNRSVAVTCWNNGWAKSELELSIDGCLKYLHPITNKIVDMLRKQSSSRERKIYGDDSKLFKNNRNKIQR